MLENDNKTLRYAAKMVPIRPEDKTRPFIINYRLANDMISIYEPPIRNSGIIGKLFLSWKVLPRPELIIISASQDMTKKLTHV